MRHKLQNELAPSPSSRAALWFPNWEQGLEQGDDITHGLSAHTYRAQAKQDSLSCYRWKKKLFFFSKAFGRVTTACARQKTAFFSASYQLRFQCMWSCAVNRDGNSDKQVVCALLEPSSASSGEAWWNPRCPNPRPGSWIGASWPASTLLVELCWFMQAGKSASWCAGTDNVSLPHYWGGEREWGKDHNKDEIVMILNNSFENSCSPCSRGVSLLRAGGIASGEGHAFFRLSFGEVCAYFVNSNQTTQ